MLRDLIKKPESKMELYDLESDPHESNDLAEDLPDKVAELTATLISAREEPEIERFRFWKYGEVGESR